MLLFVGLGNPERGYSWNRHNVGFKAVEAIAKQYSVVPWSHDSWLDGDATRVLLGQQEVMLLKPGLYMNHSGAVVSAAVQHYKIKVPEIVVFHDEVELPPGEVRVRKGGGNAGHNGLRSISAHRNIGNDYRRVRIGIGHPGKNLNPVHEYVLSNFRPEERQWVEALCDTIGANAGLLAAGEDEEFQNVVYDEMDSKKLVTLRRPPSWRPRIR